MAVTLIPFTNQQIENFQEHIVGVYREAFRAPPYGKREEEVLDFAESLPVHMQREGFRFVAAIEGTFERIAGFTYGHLSVPGQFWYENVLKVMAVELANEWLMQSFQLVEVAVTPETQGQGIGGRLHDRLLSGLTYGKAVLSTIRVQTAAYCMYRRRGWQVLVEDMRFPEVDRPYRIMGRDLAPSQGGNTD